MAIAQPQSEFQKLTDEQLALFIQQAESRLSAAKQEAAIRGKIVQKYPQSEVYTIRGEISEKNGGRLFLYADGQNEWINGKSLKVIPASRIYLENHPDYENLAIDQKISFFAIRSGNFQDYILFKFINESQIIAAAPDPPQKQKGFPPSALDKRGE